MIVTGTKDEVATELDELDTFLAACGVNTKWFSARELCVLPFAKRADNAAGYTRPAPARKRNEVFAIPPPELRPNLVRVLVRVAQPIRAQYGRPLDIRCYRPEPYNSLVAGAKGSRHRIAEALDLRVMPGGSLEGLRRVAIDYVLDNPEIGIGLGLYRTDVHVDTREDSKVWGTQKELFEHERKRRERSR